MNTSSTVKIEINNSETNYEFNYLKNERNLEVFHFSGILFQQIRFDDKYWLNGFEFESSNNGTIKIGVNYFIFNLKHLHF